MDFLCEHAWPSLALHFRTGGSFEVVAGQRDKGEPPQDFTWLRVISCPWARTGRPCVSGAKGNQIKQLGRYRGTKILAGVRITSNLSRLNLLDIIRRATLQSQCGVRAVERQGQTDQVFKEALASAS